MARKLQILYLFLPKKTYSQWDTIDINRYNLSYAMFIVNTIIYDKHCIVKLIFSDMSIINYIFMEWSIVAYALIKMISHHIHADELWPINKA